MLTDSTAAVRLGAGRAACRLTIRCGGNQGLRHRAECRQQQAQNASSRAENLCLACRQRWCQQKVGRGRAIHWLGPCGEQWRPGTLPVPLQLARHSR